MAEPTSRTSNYGWALWHLDRAQHATDAEGALVHAACAQARAALAAVDEAERARRGDDYDPSRSTWEEETDA